MRFTALRLSKMASPDVKDNLKRISERVAKAYDQAEPKARANKLPRLVAVSKTKPKELIYAAYEAGHRDFGENYVKELHEKASDPELQSACPEIRWHFIGSCQTNKVSLLCRTPNLELVETIGSSKLADKMHSYLGKQNQTVKIFIQINTSGEENKSGIEPSEIIQFSKHIIENCPSLKIAGLMTIGALGHSVAKDHEGSNPDFLCLIKCRDELLAEFKDLDPLELSMGMSNDFEEAIQLGSTNVRVGSSIFGARDYANK